MLPLRYCENRRIAVLGPFESEEQLYVGLQNLAEQEEIEEMLQRRFSRPITLIELADFEIDRALDLGYGDGLVGGAADHQLNIETPALPSSASASQILDDILLHALQQDASDIHIEAYPGDVDVRLRISGVLHQLQTPLSPALMAELVSRVKVLAQLDVAERRRPQDGHFRVSVKHGQRRYPIDFRVNVLPGPHGEDAVLRVLDPDMGLLPIEQLGMTSEMADEFLRLLRNPEGCVLVTGPTGSGKTSTLYSAIEHIRDGTKKIVTAEDPIEYQVAKVNQKQVTHAMDMASIARAFLRHDPDVILVGEIRDEATATVTSRAATTGHLVLSTLHTADALGAISRLRGLGLMHHEVAEFILAVVAQRLVRTICPDCQVDQELSRDEQRLLGYFARGLSQRAGTGCSRCHQTGFAGRVGIFELLVFDQELQDLVHAGSTAPELRCALAARAHHTLLHDGLLKVREGKTTVAELQRVIPYREIRAVVDAAETGAI